VSLRKDIHSAFDVITPPLGGMPERVVHSVLAEHDGRQRKEGMGYRVRVPLALVAVFMVVVIGVAALAWSSLHHASPVGPAGPTAVQQLEARPLKLTALAAGAACPLTALATQAWGGQTGIYGTPPAGVGEAGFGWSGGWGRYWDLFAVTTADVTGPVLVRGRDLRTGREMVFIGGWSFGPVVGTDTWPDGTTVPQRPELVLDPGHPTHESAGPGLAQWPFVAGVAGGGTVCLGVQLDAAGFTRTVVLAG
jgi:hypothetical protein